VYRTDGTQMQNCKEKFKKKTNATIEQMQSKRKSQYGA